MHELSSCNPTGRFTGLAANYARYRPDYPEAALAFLTERCGLGPDALLIDLGCGTGISARLFARRGVRVIGVDPNADMLRQAETEAAPEGCPPPVYRAGRAEATGLPDASADVVLAAQAFHWFEADVALRECHRLLKPGGWAVLMWNERDESEPFTAAYGAATRAVPEAEAVETPRGQAGEPLLACPLFVDRERRVFPHEQVLDEEAMLGRAFSASYAPRQPDQAELYAARLRAAFARFQNGGAVRLRYATSVYRGRRPALVTTAPG